MSVYGRCQHCGETWGPLRMDDVEQQAWDHLADAHPECVRAIHQALSMAVEPK